jgi:hypothetical protein
MTPLLRPLWWAATRFSFSITSSRARGDRDSASRAAARPTMPAPMMTISKRGLAMASR